MHTTNHVGRGGTIETRFALRLKQLHPDHDLTTDSLTRETVALLTALEDQRDARFVLQTIGWPNLEQPERGRLDVDLIVAVEGQMGKAPDRDRVEELADDLLDLTGAPPLRWHFAPVTDATTLKAVLEPFHSAFFAEIVRREESCSPTEWSSSMGFGTMVEDRIAERPIWGLWTLGRSTGDLRRLASVLLAQEAPVCTRAIVVPTSLTAEEHEEIEQLVASLASTLPDQGVLRASLRTVESLLYVRPLFEIRLVVTSTEPLSRSLLSAIGFTASEPATYDDLAVGVLKGGYAVLKPSSKAASEELTDAYLNLSLGPPTSSLAPAPLQRLRRLLGPWEAASIFHIPVAVTHDFPGLPTSRVPNLEPPLAALPPTGRRLGELVGPIRRSVNIDPEERFRHLYIAGQTGTGKSTLLSSLALQDIRAGSGVAVIDPHGDLVETLLNHIPEDRIDDVILVDPSDREAVVGVNLLEAETTVQEEYVVSELCSMFYALFDPNNQGIVGPRFESWLRQAALLLLANPDLPASFLDIATVFIDPAVRKRLVTGIDDPILNEFWLGEMGQTSDFHKSEMIGWFRSKFEIFRTSRLVRNVVGQARSTFSFADVLSNKRILLVNLSKGLLGDYNSRLIGYIVFTRLWSAALERASIPQDQRSDFFLYVDEFQNFTTASLPVVLSEARKFRVGVTLANQFFTQVPEMTRDAIMGNVGARATFRLGPKDAHPFSEWLGPAVSADDLTGLPNYVAICALTDRGVPLDPLVLRTDPPSEIVDSTRAETVRQRSRKQWARPVGEVEKAFLDRWVLVPDSIAARAHAAARKSPPHVTPGQLVDDWLTQPSSEHGPPDGPTNQT